MEVLLANMADTMRAKNGTSNNFHGFNVTEHLQPAVWANQENWS